MKKLVCALFAAAALAAGCGLSEPVTRGSDPDIAAIKKEYSSPKGWKVRVDPIEMAIGTEPGEKEWVLKLDGAEIQKNVVESLRETGVFQEISAAGSEAEADLALKLKVTGAIGRFEGTNGNEILQLLVWWGFSSLLGCLVADEDYSAWIQVEATVADSSTGDTVWNSSFKPNFSGSLDHYQKGIDLWDLIPPGTIVSSHDPDKVTEKLLPHLMRKLEIDLVRKLASEVPPPPVDVVVVIGADAESGGAKTSLAASDAKRFANAFGRNRARVEAVDLTGKASDAAALKQALAALAARKEISIRDLVVYFAGCGSHAKSASGAAVPALVLSAKAGSVSTILLAEFIECVKAIPAESRGVILDASFETGKGRFIGSAGVPAGPVEFPHIDKIALLYAGGASESAEAGGGLLTSSLVSQDVLGGDANRDGKVAFAEYSQGFGFGLSRAIRRAGGSGTMSLSGDAVLFRVPKTADKPEDKPSETPDAPPEDEGEKPADSPGEGK